MKKKLAYLTILSVALTTVSCRKDFQPRNDLSDTQKPNAVLTWNQAGQLAVSKLKPPPMIQSRLYAMINISMHDALNSIIPKYETYAATAALTTADPDAAVAQAAHDVISAAIAPARLFADSLLIVSLAAIAPGDAKDKGIAIGKQAALAILNKRMNDGASTAQIPFLQGINPGEYRSTPPFDRAPFNGFVSLAGWGQVIPFALNTASQFRPGAPYALNSPQYATDFNEIKLLGCDTCKARTADQTQIGLFWLDNVPNSWNNIARTLILKNGLSAWKAAKLLALLQIAEADANIAAFDGKYYYKFWRPITAVRNGDNDLNSATTGDPTWNVLAPPTPPVPDYPSNHAVNAGAAATILQSFFGSDNSAFSATSVSLPGVTRSFSSFSQAADETALSRIYVGYHFRNAVEVGKDVGKKVGQYVFASMLK